MTTKEIVDTYGDLAHTMGITYKLRPSLILAVIAQESSGNPKAVSSCGARGLMQLMEPAVIDFDAKFRKAHTFDDMFDPEKNVETGSGYLSMLIQRFGDDTLGVRAYNQGAGRVKRNPDAGKWYSDGVMAHEKSVIALI